MIRTILTLDLAFEHDVVQARQRARQIAGLLGFDGQDQTRIATAVSEIARNAFRFAHAGKVEYAIADLGDAVAFQICVRDNGPGIQDVHAVLSGKSGSGNDQFGLVSVRRLMDHFHIDSEVGVGTTVVIAKILPSHAASHAASNIVKIAEEIAKGPPQNPLQEVQQQNQALLNVLQQLQERQTALENQRLELAQLNHELEDTNRGVVALYSELDEKADYLRRASEMKSRFLSNMSHEFRTPLNSIIGLTRLLLDRCDGDLTPEQMKQVSFIRKAAEDLTEIVNDLLDIAKLEAGKVVMHTNEFEAPAFFGALRGMLRPLLAHNSSVALNFDDPVDVPPLQTDEGKVSQILRNFISNALKFTERGEIRVSACCLEDDMIAFSVADTGLGIAQDDCERIFHEFTQLDSDRQRKVKGTGLGLPLSRKLAELLGGHIRLQSTLGEGSTFTLVIPRMYQGATDVSDLLEITTQRDLTRLPILVVEDNRETLFIYEEFLNGSGFQLIPARTLRAAKRALADFQPAAIILDVLLDGENSWDFLAELKRNPATNRIPVLVVTMVDNQQKALALGADAFATKPMDRTWMLDKLRALVGSPAAAPKVLIIDDDDASRYLLRSLLGESQFKITETPSGVAGVEMAIQMQPAVVFLDLDIPDLSGWKVLDQLRSDPRSERIPVIINTSRILADSEYVHLASRAAAILSKSPAHREVAIARLRDALKKAGLS
jgi:signal transduction histidine kinase/CheY-like chemotaxis protein